MKEVGMVSQRHQQAYRLQELGDFLRTRRARLMPEEVGLPRGTRRKTPGLRRAEVAQMVGVSVDWYTWLEQARSITPSTQVLERLVQTLRLDANERTHLFFLAQQQAPPALLPETETVSPALQHFLDQFGTRPAFVSGRRWDILAWNDAGCVIFGDYRKKTARERNTIWDVFTNPLSRQYIVNWEEDARQLLAQFRSSCGRYPGDVQLTELIHDLMLASPEFRAWWPDHEVLGGQEWRKTLNHPQVGHLQFERLTFQVFDAPDLKVTVYTPLEGTDTQRKLEQLLEQWYQSERQEPRTLKTVYHLPQVQQSEQDTVGLWLAACGKRVEGAWVANGDVMISYAKWCEAHGYEPKKAKGVSQSLAVHGLEISVNKRVVDEHRRQKMARGVRGLIIL
ncbi:MAG TPA: helix-turn-helix domain-containing protein [Ktedonobacteraceae bacterium]|jgi:transcriptional regulator with XRE-family HTH domain|nr:helix-turn-helix domain-containing protein [Ktedonobacteraceae bacterium]